MSEAAHWNSMYEKPVGEIPWEIAGPPSELVRALEEEELKPCKALDLGCGTGNYAIYLAKRGFSMTGVDISERALQFARRKAEEAGVEINFVLSDATELRLPGPFDFIFDYSLLHHIHEGKLREYAHQSAGLLSTKGKLLLVCFSEKDEDSGGKHEAVGKYGNVIFFRTAKEIRAAYKELAQVYYYETALGKRLHHAGHCFMFQKP